VLAPQVWNSETSEDVRKGILSELVSDEPELRLLYTTPESLRNPSLRDYLKVGAMEGVLLLVMRLQGLQDTEVCLQDTGQYSNTCLHLQLLLLLPHCLCGLSGWQDREVCLQDNTVNTCPHLKLFVTLRVPPAALLPAGSL
jgi:hypothetical protein